jgi:hypothetical protein
MSAVVALWLFGLSSLTLIATLSCIPGRWRVGCDKVSLAVFEPCVIVSGRRRVSWVCHALSTRQCWSLKPSHPVAVVASVVKAFWLSRKEAPSLRVSVERVGQVVVA